MVWGKCLRHKIELHVNAKIASQLVFTQVSTVGVTMLAESVKCEPLRSLNRSLWVRNSNILFRFLLLRYSFQSDNIHQRSHDCPPVSGENSTLLFVLSLARLSSL